MGKGDKKSRRGKIHIGSYGKRRPHPKSNPVPVRALPATAEKTVKQAEPPVKKAAKPVEAEEVVEVTAETAAPKKTAKKTPKKTKEEPAAE